MNTAIIVAAGSGKRFGGDVPKQFVEIGGKPVLIHTLEKFENCAAIDEIVLVLSAGEIENFQKTLAKFEFKKITRIVAGGGSRAVSVLNGLNALDSRKTKIVAVHDGARPLVSPEEIAATIEKAGEIGAACLTAKVTDTIKKAENGKIVETVDRAHLRRALTPQTFQIDILKRAFAAGEIETATDECSLVEKLGVQIADIEGSPKNIKITELDDLKFAKVFLK